MSYRVFYYASESEDPDDLVMRVYDSSEGGRPPARGIQAIVQDHPQVGVEVTTQADFYVLRKGRWYGVDWFGLFDYLLDSGIVIFGRTVSKDEYKAIMDQVNEEKHGWTAREVRPR